MPKLTFQQDFSRLSFADLYAMLETSYLFYKDFDEKNDKERAHFFYKIRLTISAELQRRLIEKFTAKP